MMTDSQPASQAVLEQAQACALTSVKDSALYYERERYIERKGQSSLESVEMVQCICGSTTSEGLMVRCPNLLSRCRLSPHASRSSAIAVTRGSTNAVMACRASALARHMCATHVFWVRRKEICSRR